MTWQSRAVLPELLTGTIRNFCFELGQFSDERNSLCLSVGIACVDMHVGKSGAWPQELMF